MGVFGTLVPAAADYQSRDADSGRIRSKKIHDVMAELGGHCEGRDIMSCKSGSMMWLLGVGSLDLCDCVSE